jgi:hypothetical protein
MHTKQKQEKAIARLQKILDFCLALLKSHAVDNTHELIAHIHELYPIIMRNRCMIENKMGMLQIEWGLGSHSDYLNIQYYLHKADKPIVADSSRWDEKGIYQGVGHIQTAYSNEMTDPTYRSAILGMLKNASDWKVRPDRRKKSR